MFGGMELTWKKLLISAVLVAVFTALTGIIPQLKYTSFSTILATLEVWILFGIIIIMNSKSNKDSALKCFVFFLVSQPLIYLLQVPFSWQGWKLFQYYKFWFIMTVLCLPMGYIGYYIKKNKWYGYLILLPMIALTLYSYHTYLTYFTFDRPYYLLISVFCILTSILYPIVLFDDKRIKRIGFIISMVLVIGITVWVFTKPYVYSFQILPEVDGKNVTEEYRVELEDGKYGEASVVYLDGIESCMIRCDIKKRGKTVLTVTTPEGRKVSYKLTVYHDTYQLDEQ